MLAEGADVSSIARTLEVQENTIRMHLKRIYSKTGTRDQVDLVRLILKVSRGASDL